MNEDIGEDFLCMHNTFRQLGGKRVYLYTLNSNQLDPFAFQLTIYLDKMPASRVNF